LVVLFVLGRMVEIYKRGGQSNLLRATTKCWNKRCPMQLVMVGEGPDRAGYEL